MPNLANRVLIVRQPASNQALRVYGTGKLLCLSGALQGSVSPGVMWDLKPQNESPSVVILVIVIFIAFMHGGSRWLHVCAPGVDWGAAPQWTNPHHGMAHNPHVARRPLFVHGVGQSVHHSYMQACHTLSHSPRTASPFSRPLGRATNLSGLSTRSHRNRTESARSRN